jgi:hypothetical protein
MSRRPRLIAPSRAALSALALLSVTSASCGDATSDAKNDTDIAHQDASTASGDGSGASDTEAPAPGEVFAAGMRQGQTISAGPFPNDALRAPNGRTILASLASDPVWSTLAKPAQIARLEALIADRVGFSFTSAAFFPMAVAPDLASFDGAVDFLALTGPDAGARFPGQVSWFEPGRMLAVMPAWGHALTPDATYAIVIADGPQDTLGRPIERPPIISAALAAQAPADLDPAAAAVRSDASWTRLREALGDAPLPLMATVYTTEASLPWLASFLTAADAAPLEAPRPVLGSRSTSAWEPVPALDLSGAALANHLGTPTGPFAFSPTHWDGGTRADAASIPGQDGAYTGGAFGGKVGRVVQGGLVMPSFNLAPDGNFAVASRPRFDLSGRPEALGRTLVPFSLYLCEQHLAPEAPAVKVAVFTHGGTEIRSQALPFAVANCAHGVATVALDLPFHGGRQTERFFATEGFFASTSPDTQNAYSGKAEPDGVGDPGGATVSVGGLFGLPSDFDPEVIEINLATIAIETRVLLRYLRDAGPEGLGAFAGVTFDAARVMHDSLSFGSSFSMGLWALDPTISHIVASVPSGGILSLNLPMAPNNAGLVSGVVDLTLGLARAPAALQTAAWSDPILATVQWLSQRADPLAYAPYVLRNRPSGALPHLAMTGNSWDETLFGPAQLSLNTALGVPVFADAARGWAVDATMPGASEVTAAAFPQDAIADNFRVGDASATAALFYLGTACHAHITSPVCRSNYQPPYPPGVARAAPLTSASPLCEVHAAFSPFIAAFAAGDGPTSIAPPDGRSCEALYGGTP